MKTLRFPQPKQITYVGKVFRSLWCYRDRLLGQANNGQYYASKLRQLKEVINMKFREKLRAGLMLLQDNAHVHEAYVTVAEAANCDFGLSPHVPYSSNMRPTDIYLFPKLISHPCGHHFGSIH